MQRLELNAHARAQGGVEIRQRLVEEEDFRVAHDGPPDGDTLALAAGERLRQALEVVGNLQDLRRGLHAAIDLVLRHLGDLEAEREVVVNRLVRIQRVALEDHRHAAARGGDVIDSIAGDLQIALADLFKPGNHSQQGRFSATGRTDKDDELTRFDVEIDTVDDFELAVALLDTPETNIGLSHLPAP